MGQITSLFVRKVVEEVEDSLDKEALLRSVGIEPDSPVDPSQMVAAAVLGTAWFNGVDRWLVLAAAATYLIGVQLPKIAINVPLNNQLQRQDVDAMTELSLREVRTEFEPRWIRWNAIRTIFAILTSALLIGLEFKI
ncbi:hypothetical protein C7293_28810 [filamentous cyanobacterium CCT1]|nr:hypothetical protein C7293_28810 [filamentous cyanobacterium CCT1]PSN76525.1 hypothetical protein C8B47_26865 [filamentous cyanobacterium CCP4]